MASEPLRPTAIPRRYILVVSRTQRIVRMSWIYASVIGVALGSALGWTAEHVRVAPLVQSVAAFVVALVLGDVGVQVWWPSRSVGHIYLAFGIENLFYVGMLSILAGAVHVGLGRVAGVLFPALLTDRALILGLAGGLFGTLSGTWAIQTLMSQNGR